MATAKKLPSGSWNIVIFDGKENGKRKYKSFTAPTKKEVEYAAANYNLNQKQLNLPQNMTLKEAYEKYIESKNNVLSPGTIREYKRISSHDLQQLMPYKLSNLTQELVQIAVNQESITHSPKSIRNMHGLLSAVLNAYCPSFQLHTRLPQKIKTDIYIPTDDDIKKLLAATKGDDMHIAILLASVGTLRRAEICALLNTDVTDTGVNVTNSMAKNDKGEWVVKTTKTTAGKRFVELPQNVISELKTKKGHVFPYKPGTLTRKFHELTKNVLGHSFRFHDLRHYSASVLHTLGVPDVYIMARGGWESRDTLNRVYTHVMSKEQEQINKKIMAHFEDGLLSDDKENEAMQNEMQNADIKM